MRDLLELAARAKKFSEDAHRIFSVHETSLSRLISLEKSYKSLEALGAAQDELFIEALKCIESKLYRPAHVMAWAAFMDFMEEQLAADNFAKLRKIRPKWNFKSLDDLREVTPEAQLIDAYREIGFCTKNEAKALHGLLNKRNECAHPSHFRPDLNEALGYVSELLKRLKTLRSRRI